jgi:hypothetical protein
MRDEKSYSKDKFCSLTGSDYNTYCKFYSFSIYHSFASTGTENTLMQPEGTQDMGTATNTIATTTTTYYYYY